MFASFAILVDPLAIVSQFAVNPPWHQCKSVPWQASNLQFSLQAQWHIGMMEFCVTPMLAKKGGAYHSSLHFSWAWELAIFFGECVSLISAKYHLFIFPLTLTLTLADHCCHP
jgi:hypothetical protein